MMRTTSLQLLFFLVFLVTTDGSHEKRTPTELKGVMLSALKNMQHHLHEKSVDMLIESAKPANIKAFIKLVMASRVRNKGEVIRICMTLLNKKSDPERIVTSIKSLPQRTIEDVSLILVHYFEMLAEKMYGNKVRKTFKFINENDIKSFVKIFFDAFNKASNEELVWLIITIRKDKEELREKTKDLLKGDSEILTKTINKEKEEELRGKVIYAIEAMQRFSHIFNNSELIIQLTDASKEAANHLIDVTWNETKDTLGNLNPQKTFETIKRASDAIQKFITYAKEYTDVDDIGENVEKVIIHLQNLNHHEIKKFLKALIEFFPSIEDFNETIDKLNVSSGLRTKLKNIISSVHATNVPDLVFDMAVNTLSYQINSIDPKTMRAIIENAVKEMKVENEVYDAIKNVLKNSIEEKLKLKKGQFNVTSQTFDEMVKRSEAAISQIDGEKVEKLFNEVFFDINNVDPRLAGDLVTDTAIIVRDLIHSNMIQTFFQDPKHFLNIVNRTLVYDLVSASVDWIKLLNENKTYCRCLVFANFNQEERKNAVNNLTEKITDAFLKVQHGKKALSWLKINEISKLSLEIMEILEVKNVCIDLKGIIKLMKEFDRTEKEEIVSLIMKTKDILQNKKGGLLDDIVDILEAAYKVTLRKNGNNENDFRAQYVKAVLKFFKDNKGVIETSRKSIQRIEE